MQQTTDSLTVDINPGTVYITTVQGQSSYSNITVKITNTTTAAIPITGIGILIPQNLYQTGSLNSINPSAGQSTKWNFTAQPTAGAYIASPVSGTNVQLAAGGDFTFILNNVTLAQQTGTAVVTVKVKLADGTIVTQTPSITMALATDAITTFNAIPSNINPGQSASLIWACTGFDYCKILPINSNQLPISGSTQVSPPSTTIYTLYAFKASITLSAQWGVSVANPQIITFGGTDGQNSLDYGEMITLVWTCNQFTQSVKLSSDNSSLTFPANLPVSGSTTVGPINKNTNFELTAFGSIKSDFTTATAPCTVNPPTAVFTATPDSGVWEQDSVTLNWQITSAATVTVSPALPNGPSLQNLSGSLVINPVANVDYVLTVTGAPGTTPATVTVSFNVSQVVLTSFSASPNIIAVDAESNQATLSWVTQAQVVNISPGIGSVAATGGSQLIAAPADGTVYTLTAGTNQHPALQTSTVTIVNSYGPYQFNQFSTLPPTALNGFNVLNPGSFVYLKDMLQGGAYILEMTGAEIAGGMPAGSILVGFTNYVEKPTSNLFFVAKFPVDQNYSFVWTNPAQPQGSFTITGIFTSTVTEFLAEHAQQLEGFKTLLSELP